MKSTRSTEQMVRDMLVDATFLSDIKSNPQVRAMVLNLVQDLSKEVTDSESRDCIESVVKEGESPKVGNVWVSWNVVRLCAPSKRVVFFTLEVQNGEVFARLSMPDVQKEVQYWSNAVVVYVLGANPPFLVMNGYLRRIWKEYSIDKILQVQLGVFLVRFWEGTTRDVVI